MGQQANDTEERLIELAASSSRRIGKLKIAADFGDWFDLITLAQLALRLPNVKNNPAAQRGERMIRELIEQIDPDHTELWRLLSAGFDRV